VNPQVVIEVTLNGTSHGDAGFGGAVAAPVFREVAMHALRMLDVPKDLPDASKKGPIVTSVKDPSFNDLAVAGLGGEPPLAPSAGATEGGARLSPIERSVSSVTPPPVRAATPASAGEVALDRRPFFKEDGLVASALGPAVPDFHGLTLRAVLERSAALGLP